MRVMITNGGTHPPDKWAVVTAEHIFNIDPSVDGDRLLAAKRVQLAIADALLPHHTKVRDSEKTGLKEKGDNHFDCAMDHEQHLDDAVAAVVAATVGSPWEAHYAREDVQATIRQEIGNHFCSVMDIERQHHAGRHPHHKKACAYHKARHPEPVAPQAEV